MKNCLALCSIVLAAVLIFCHPTRATATLRVRRQGWEWGDENPPPLSTSSERPFPTGPPPPFTTTTTADQVAENNARIARCIATCPATPQYNPVCGTDNQNYNNEGRLNCARNCGQTVELLHLGTCTANR